MIHETTVPAHHPDVASTIADQEAVLVLPSQGRVQVLNEVGTRVWQLIDAERDVASIVSEICREYQVDRERAFRDTIQFLTDLSAKQLLTLHGDGNSPDAAPANPAT